MKFLEKVRINFHQIDRGGIRQADRFHETKQKEQIVELQNLPVKLLFITGERQPVNKLADGFP